MVLVSDPPNGYSIIETYTHTLSEIIHTIINLISGLIDKFRKVMIEVVNENNVLKAASVKASGSAKNDTMWAAITPIHCIH